MQIALIYLFLAVVGLTGHIAATKGDKTLLIPAGVLLILAGSFSAATSVESHSGWSITETQVDSNTTEITKVKTYSSLETQTGVDKVNEFFGISLAALGLYFTLVGVVGKKKDNGIF